MAKHIKRDPLAFEGIWKNVVIPWYKLHLKEPGISMSNENDAHNRVKEAYDYLNRYYTSLYMEEEEPLLNQRKVAACWVYAVVATKPIDVDLDVLGCWEPAIEGIKGSLPALANERLAIGIIIAVIETYVERAVEDSEHYLTKEQNKAAAEALKRGMNLLYDVDGGEWLLNFERSLGWTVIEGNYNLPLLSCLIAYLESTILPGDIYAEALRAFRRASEDEAV